MTSCNDQIVIQCAEIQFIAARLERCVVDLMASKDDPVQSVKAETEARRVLVELHRWRESND